MEPDSSLARSRPDDASQAEGRSAGPEADAPARDAVPARDAGPAGDADLGRDAVPAKDTEPGREAGKGRPGTGDPRVDKALHGLDELAELPVGEHPQVFERIHGQLVEVLGELRTGADMGDRARNGDEARNGDKGGHGRQAG